MLLALFAVLSSKRTKSNPILYFCTVFRPWKMTQSRKQPIFDTKRKIYLKARFKYILPLFAPLGTRCTFSNQAAVVGCSAKLCSRMRVYFLIQTACIQNATRRTTLRKSRSCSNSRICCSYRETSIACNSVLSAAKNLAEFFWRPQVIRNTLFWW